MLIHLSGIKQMLPRFKYLTSLCLHKKKLSAAVLKMAQSNAEGLKELVLAHGHSALKLADAAVLNEVEKLIKSAPMLECLALSTQNLQGIRNATKQVSLQHNVNSAPQYSAKLLSKETCNLTASMHRRATEEKV